MDELRALFPRHPGWAVSLFMPAHRRGRETEQDPIRFKNLLREVEERLGDKNVRRPDVQQMLEPAHRLLEDASFWWHQSDGLAAFITAEEARFYRVPLPFESLIVVANRYHLKPLLPLFTDNGHFYILALSQGEVRLLEGTRNTVDEIDLEHMPGSLVDALQFERYERQMQFHTGTSAGHGDRAAAFFGHDPSDEDKTRILRWFRKIDSELSSLLAGERSPLVLAGVEYLLPLYTQANSYAHLLDDGIHGNPEELRPEDLHTRAWPIVHPTFVAVQEEAAARYRQLSAAGKTMTGVEETVAAAHHGRVDTLFVALNAQVWGAYDTKTDTVQVRESPEPGDEDLLDLAAIESLLNGGSVYAVEPEQVPDGGPLAAVLRY